MEAKLNCDFIQFYVDDFRKFEADHLNMGSQSSDGISDTDTDTDTDAYSTSITDTDTISENESESYDTDEELLPETIREHEDNVDNVNALDNYELIFSIIKTPDGFILSEGKFRKK